MRIIRTARLRLVPVTSANATVLWEVLQGPELRDYQDLPDVNRAQFLRIVGARPTRLGSGSAGRFEWLVHYASGNEALGWVSLRISEGSRFAAEIGYSVVHAHRGHGIATEAVGALIEEGFRRARLREIRAFCLPENRASRAVLRNLGFVDEGVLERGASVGGRTVDIILHSLEQTRWAESFTPNQAATQ